MQLKKVFLGVGLSLMSGVALAVTYAAPPRDASIPQPALVYPSYSSPVNKSLQPTVDAASYTYLRWMGSNVQLLVNYADFFYQLQKSESDGASGAYMAPITALANTQFVSAAEDTTKNSTDLTMKNVNFMLAYGDDSTLKADFYAALPGTDIESPSSDNYTFNANNLIGTKSNPSGEKDKDKVDQLIMFLTGGAKPLGGLTFSTDEKKRKQQLAGSDVKDYLLRSRIAAAAASVAYSNLNYLAQERQVVPDLGTKAGMTTLPTDGGAKNIKDASQLELEAFLVNRRVGNTSWYTNVNTASSIAVQRETLFVLAEMEKQMFEQKILLERMLAEQVALQTQQEQLTRTKLEYDRQSVQKNLASY